MIIIVVQFSLRPRPPLRKSSRAYTHTKPRFWGKRKRTRRRLHRSLNSLFFRSSLSVCLFLFLFRVRKCVVVRKFSLASAEKFFFAWNTKCKTNIYFILCFTLICRSYHVKSIASHQHSEIKPRWAPIVLRLVITWEVGVMTGFLFAFCTCVSLNFNSALFLAPYL